MAGKLENSWMLVKASARVLQADRELLVFPLLSGVVFVLVTATFCVPLALVGGGVGWAAEQLPSWAWVTLFLFYVAQYTVVFFFNSALVGAALIRLGGGDPTVSDGLRIAAGRLSSIVGYAVIAATVGMLLKVLSERVGALGRVAVALTGMAWNLATYLVVPILVTTDMGPLRAVEASASLLRDTWGEQVAGSIGMGLAFGLMFLAFFLFAVPISVLAAGVSAFVLLLAIVLFGATFLMLVLVSSALGGIYSAALYRFAATGEAGWGFDTHLLRNAFVSKKPRTW